MSEWTDRILSEFTTELSRLWIAHDPDNLLLDERLLHNLRERGFEVLPYKDPIVFRTEYEERFRAAWDCAEVESVKELVLHYSGTDPRALPWDYVCEGRMVSLGLANLLPRLSYAVLQQINPEHLEALFEAHNKHATKALSESATKDFILTHIFRINLLLHDRSENFWHELLRLHYLGSSMPRLLADYVAAMLDDNPDFRNVPVARLLSSKSFAIQVLQSSWDHYLARYGVCSTKERDECNAILIPFDHPDVRVLVDNMFNEGILQPVEVEGHTGSLPDWAQVGVSTNTTAIRVLKSESIDSLRENLPANGSSHRDWCDFARGLSEVIYRYTNLGADEASELHTEVETLQRDADNRLTKWVSGHFADLSSLPIAKGPIMVHHVPRFLAMRREGGEERIALLVFDGLSMDQWFQVREKLQMRAPGLIMEESACFAWLPTITSVSRQALFSGLRPRDFPASIDTTSKERSHWLRFWQENGLRNTEVLYRKGLKRTDQLSELADDLSQPSIKVAGIVVDMVDEIVHGAMLGKRGVAHQVSEWCDTGFVDHLMSMLMQHGFHVYLTSDHGNVEAKGIGRINRGVVANLKGERVRIYRSEHLAKQTIQQSNLALFDVPGLPVDYLPIFAGVREAFVPKGDRVVSHGGISVEEVIVPFVRLSKKDGE